MHSRVPSNGVEVSVVVPVELGVVVGDVATDVVGVVVVVTRRDAMQPMADGSCD